MGKTAGVGEHPADELPMYLDDDRPARPAAAAPRVTARDVAGKVGQWVTEIVEGDGEMAPPKSLDLTDEGTKDDTIVIHRVLGSPAALLAAFDQRWGLQPTRSRVALGTLALRPPDDAGRGPTRTLGGQMHLRVSFLAVPVELEVTPWHTYGIVLTLRPDKRNGAAVAWHRRRAWFAAGHRILDQMRLTLEATR